MGSPLQSAWILGNILFQVNQTGLIEFDLHPRQILTQLCTDLQLSRDRVFPGQVHTKYMDIFACEIQSLSRPLIFKADPLESDDEGLTQEIAESIAQIEAELLPTGQTGSTLPATPGFEFGVVPGFANFQNSHQFQPSRPVTVPPAPELSHQFPQSRTVTKKPAASEPRSRSRSRDRCTDTRHEFMVSPAVHSCATKETPDFTNAATAEVVSLPAEAIVTKDPGDLSGDDAATEDVTPEPEVYVIFPEGHALNVGFSSGCTVQNLLQAEHALHPAQTVTAVSFLGSPLAADLPLHPDMALMFRDSTSVSTPASRQTHAPPVLKGATRAELLWQQQGWVAVDEMDFYLHMIEAANPTTILGTYEFPDTADATAMFAHRLLKAIETAGSDVNSAEKAMAWNGSTNTTGFLFWSEPLSLMLKSGPPMHK